MRGVEGKQVPYGNGWSVLSSTGHFWFSWRRIGRSRGNWGHLVDSERGPLVMDTI